MPAGPVSGPAVLPVPLPPGASVLRGAGPVLAAAGAGCRLGGIGSVGSARLVEAAEEGRPEAPAAPAGGGAAAGGAKVVREARVVAELALRGLVV
jgi:hypothetical protein